MKHICHVTIMHPPFDTRIFRNECVSLANHGYQVTLLAPHTQQEKVEGVQLIPVKSPKGFYERLFSAPKAAIEQLHKIDADLFHFHDPELLPAMGIFAGKTKHKVVWDAHENYVHTIKSFNSLKLPVLSNLGSVCFDLIERKRVQKNFIGVVTVSESMANRYKKWGAPTAAVGNFSNIGKIPEPEFEQRFKRPMRFISSGVQIKERGIFEIAKAFCMLQTDLPSELAFSGLFRSEHDKSQLRGHLANLDEKKQSLITGPHTWEDLTLGEIPKAHVGMVLFDTSDPNNREGLPNRFFECWSNGLAIITNAGTRVAELVEQENGGRVVPDYRPETLAKAMKELVENPQLTMQMGKNGRRAVVDKYSWEKAFANLLALYNQLGV